jgi:hypothetical protein
LAWLIHREPEGVTWNVRAERDGDQVVQRGTTRTYAAAERDTIAAIVALVTGRRHV